MTRREVCNRMRDGMLSIGVRLTHEQASHALGELENLAREQLAANGKFTMPGMARLELAQAAARRGYNPITKQPIRIPARRVVRAYAAKVLRDEFEESGDATA